MSERDDRPAAEETAETAQRLREDAQEGASPSAVGALDGAAAMGGSGAVSTGKSDSAIPEQAPDPSIGPD